VKLKLALLAAAAALVAPAIAIAQTAPSDTVKAVVEKGVTMEVAGNAGDIEYKTDGTFSGFDGMFAGTYKTDGNKLCITVDAFGIVDQCQEYPDGKKSGDSFELTSDMGPMKVTIR
jgi:phosphate-selective porin